MTKASPENSRFNPPEVFYKDKRLVYVEEPPPGFSRLWTQSFYLNRDEIREAYPIVSRFVDPKKRIDSVTYYFPGSAYTMQMSIGQRTGSVYVSLVGENWAEEDYYEVGAVYHPTSGEIFEMKSTYVQNFDIGEDWEEIKDGVYIKPVMPYVIFNLMSRKIEIYDDGDMYLEGVKPLKSQTLVLPKAACELGKFRFLFEMIDEDGVVKIEVLVGGKSCFRSFLPNKLWQNVSKDVLDENSFEWAKKLEFVEDHVLFEATKE